MPWQLEPKSGGWLERTIRMIFDNGDFQTDRDERIQLMEGSRLQHEFDVIARAPEGVLLVECKDYKGWVPKDMLTKFLGKMVDYHHTHPNEKTYGLFVVSEFDRGQYEEYREYMKRNEISFWDGQDVENVWERWKDLKDIPAFHSQLVQLLGMQPVQSEVAGWAENRMTFGKEITLKRRVASMAGRGAVAGVNLLGKGLSELAKPSTQRKIDRALFGPPPRRRRRKSKSNRRV